MSSQATQASRSRARRGVVGAALALALGLALASPASADDYEPQRAGHPLRMAAYVVHPVGVAIDYLFLRPLHWIGHRQPFATIFGHQDY
jgi:hypothetical protein